MAKAGAATTEAATITTSSDGSHAPATFRKAMIRAGSVICEAMRPRPKTRPQRAAQMMVRKSRISVFQEKRHHITDQKHGDHPRGDKYDRCADRTERQVGQAADAVSAGAAGADLGAD